MKASLILDAVDKSAVHKDWARAHAHCYLTHVFYMIEGETINGFDVGYYDKGTQKMTSFSVDANLSNVNMAGESEVFKEPDKVIKELNLSIVNVEGETALEIASKCQQEKYPQEKPFKKIIILQRLDKNQVWNITYITQTFKTLNIKIDAENGKILDDKLVNLIQMGQ